MHLKTASFLLLLLLSPLRVFAQQKPQYSQYMLNNFLLNPAISGIEEYMDVKTGFRNQWTGIDDAPQNFYLSLHTKLTKNEKPAPAAINKTPSFAASREARSIYRSANAVPHHGIGLLLLHDNIGPFSRTEVNVSYAYHLPLTDKVKLAAGAAAGVAQHALRGEGLVFANPGDAAGASWTTYRPNLSLGVWLYASGFYAGLSASELLSNTVSIGDDAGMAIGFKNHYFFTAAYKIPASTKIDLLPSVMVKLLYPLPVSVDYNLRAIYDNKLWAGVSYRQQEGLAFLAGITWDKIVDLGYSYDLGTTSLGGVSHEVVLGVRILSPNRMLSSQNLW
ncbi:type IX secretion system membrane protein PorP/SprF [Pontibacter sp. E15-1]|uniref:PorP/SprF family type IX secretion system membrane protein n=1 Tax=Pontibacter sp. E15-1 TaxID=2919918 RepID=UPI001F50308C|nr:type IX secretion system membrane protein PorP/SprF [Pontibacter sp. E15-1]MCJ8165349.1 type IX secretion system membrane protein PorP/SprF [Pontibacter sp. E15-1]